jgi:hypothetical protein
MKAVDIRVLTRVRHVNLGTSGLVLATPEPRQGDLLPWCDQTWNAGQLGVNQPLFSLTLATIPGRASFANACQAAHLLGRILKHRDDKESRRDRACCLSEAEQLHRMADALDLSLQTQSGDFLGYDNGATLVAAALCHSAQLILYGMYGCNEPDELDRPRLAEEVKMQQISLNCLKKVSLHRVRQLVQNACGSPSSFLICYCLYHAASECTWFVREYGEPVMAECLNIYVDALKEMSGRWKLAGLYLQLLEKETSS